MEEETFTGLGVSRPVADALAKRGITVPFAIQSRVIPDGLTGRDVLAQSPTGSGKTLAFGIPLVERLSSDEKVPAALVLVPTRELATQVAEELSAPANARGLDVCAVYGGAPLRSQAKRAQAAAILVATPGRLWDLIERRMIDVGTVRILVLDEADRMLDMGFQPQVDRIVRRLPKERQTLFFSATLHGEVGRLARTYTTDPGHYEAELQSSTAGVDISHSDLDHVCDAAGGGLVAWAQRAARSSSPPNGRWPVRASNMTQPSAYRSLRGPGCWPRICSGDR